MFLKSGYTRYETDNDERDKYRDQRRRNNGALPVTQDGAINGININDQFLPLPDFLEGLGKPKRKTTKKRITAVIKKKKTVPKKKTAPKKKAVSKKKKIVKRKK